MAIERNAKWFNEMYSVNVLHPMKRTKTSWSGERAITLFRSTIFQSHRCSYVSFPAANFPSINPASLESAWRNGDDASFSLPSPSADASRRLVSWQPPYFCDAHSWIELTPIAAVLNCGKCTLHSPTANRWFDVWSIHRIVHMMRRSTANGPTILFRQGSESIKQTVQVSPLDWWISWGLWLLM